MHTGFALMRSMISDHMPTKVQGEITYPFQNAIGCIVEVCERVSNFTPDFIMDVIAYLCPDWS